MEYGGIAEKHVLYIFEASAKTPMKLKRRKENNMNNLTIDLDTLTDEAKAQIKAWVADGNKPKEWPQEGDRYYFVASYGEITPYPFEGSCVVDTGNRDMGNCFRTEAEAIAYREHLKVCAELRRLADGNNAYLYYLNREVRVHFVGWTGNRHLPYMFASVESAQNAIDTIGEKRLIDYYFNYGRKA